MGDAALIVQEEDDSLWKVVWGGQDGAGTWQGPIYPNKSSDTRVRDSSCVNCLFQLSEDENEANDLRVKEGSRFSSILDRMHTIGATVFATDFTDTHDCMLAPEAIAHWGGFGGPYCVSKDV